MTDVEIMHIICGLRRYVNILRFKLVLRLLFNINVNHWQTVPNGLSEDAKTEHIELSTLSVLKIMIVIMGRPVLKKI